MSESDDTRLSALLGVLEDMAAGDLTRQAPLSPARDEIDALAYAINVLAGELSHTTGDLRRTRDAAEQANAQKSAFVRNVSHDLRSPLAAIGSFADLLSHTRLDTEQQDAVDRIRANVHVLLLLIDDLLELSRIEAGRLEIRDEPVRAADVIADVAVSMGPQAEARDLGLEVLTDARLPPEILTDRARLRQILVNLVGNAIGYTESGSIRIHARPDEARRRVFIDVTDTGVGIDLDEQGRVFAAFYRGRRRGPGAMNGSGLGLSLSRQLARQLGGDLTLLSSHPGRGSTFRLTLRLRQALERTPAMVPVDPLGTQPLAGLSVLYVEDSADVRRPVTRLMRMAGAEVVALEDGSRALAAAQGRHFDVVLMDLQMPGLDGFEATRLLRQAGIEVPILALTGYAQEDDRERSLGAGCTGHLAKPIDFDDLVRSIRSAVDTVGTGPDDVSALREG